MQVQSLQSANIINEIQLGTGISQAVLQGRRADFALLMSLFSNDVRDFTPAEQVAETPETDARLRQKFGLIPAQQLRATQESYADSATQAQHFHDGGLPAAKLQHYLHPEALTYSPENTAGFPEDVYLNLSVHERRLCNDSPPVQISDNLHGRLLAAYRQDQLYGHSSASRIQCLA